MAHPDHDRYVAACNYPGALDAAVAERHLGDYLAALGVTRRIVRIERGWRLADHLSLSRYIDSVLTEMGAAHDARAAQDALAAHAALAALAAHDARAAHAAHAARAAQDALDAHDAHDARAARAAHDARAAQDALDAQDAHDARAARAAHDARQRFAAWCIQRGWRWWSELSWEAATWLGASTPKVKAWSQPLFEAFCAGAWILHWTDDTLYWSAKPTVHVDEARRLHSETGPSLVSDVEDLYFWRGVMVPAHWIEGRANLDPNEVIRVTNVEQRAAGAAICGWPKMLSVLNSKVIDDSGSDDIGQLIALELPGLPTPGHFLKAHCPRNGIIVEGVPKVSDIDGLPIRTALHAQAWRIGDALADYVPPEIRT